jgi:hypothetical protein
MHRILCCNTLQQSGNNAINLRFISSTYRAYRYFLSGPQSEVNSDAIHTSQSLQFYESLTAKVKGKVVPVLN